MCYHGDLFPLWLCPHEEMRRCLIRNCSATGTTESDVITPWNVVSKGPRGIDYERVLSTFRSEKIVPSVLERLQAATGRSPHHFFTRDIAFSHRDFEVILNEFSQGRKFYLYTGRGPSANSMHLGHAIPFMLTKHLQELFQCPLVIQITDDEKILFRDIPMDKMEKMVANNIRDVLAFGFLPEKTFIFCNTTYFGSMYRTVLDIQRMFTGNMVKNTLGLQDSDNIGKFAFPATQAAPAFVSAFPKVLPIRSPKVHCLIPCAIDQDPFFVLTRNVAERLKRCKPALLHTKFLPSLRGPTHKMSSSAEERDVILLSDTDAEVRRKMKSAFSGGQPTLELLKERGADLGVDVAFQMMNVFCSDDLLLSRVAEDYRSGKITSGDMKTLASDTIIREVLHPWRERRASLTDLEVEKFSLERSIF